MTDRGQKLLRDDRPVSGLFGILLRSICLALRFPGVAALFLGGMSAAASVPVGSVTGEWVEGLPVHSHGDDWQAQWVWAEAASSSEIILARKTFSLAERPDSAGLRISASSLYELYVNGTYVGRGPARSVAHHQSYDDLEIGSLLTAGENVLAVRVHYQTGSMSYGRPSRGGLLAQLEVKVGDDVLVVASDESWSVRGGSDWTESLPPMSRFNLEGADRVDLRRFPHGWTAVDFDASAWPRAVARQRDYGWPTVQPEARPGALVPPWTSLLLRDIPYLEEAFVAPVKLLAAQQIESDGSASLSDPADPTRLRGGVRLNDLPDAMVATSVEAWFGGQGPLVLPSPADGRDWFLLFDLGTTHSGLPVLEIDAPADTLIEVMGVPFMLEGTFNPHIVASSYLDRLLVPDEPVSWRATYFKPTRFLALRIAGAKGPTEISRFGVDALRYPFELPGGFSAPERPGLEALWQASAQTIRVSTTDAFTDNYRERRQYVQTAYYAAIGNYWTFGDTALHLRCLRQAADEQRADGWMPAYAPLSGDDDMVIMDSNTAWIRGLREYFLYSGDEASVRELLPAATRLLSWLHGYTDVRGLIESPPYPYWIDHAVLDRQGANFSINAHYLGALEDFAEVLAWLGEDGAQTYRDRSDLLRAALREKFWNPNRGLFSDALIGDTQSTIFTEQSNGMALAMGVATPEQAEAVAATLLAPDEHDFARRANGMTMVTPATSYLMHAGLCRYGFVEESLAELQNRFAPMLNPETNQTLREEWWLDGTGRSGRFVGGRTRSDAQTESAFAPALFGTHVLGLEPMAPGRRIVRLRWPDSGLPEASGVMPSPLGGLTVHWQNLTRDLRLEIPAGMQVQLDLASLPVPHADPVQLNGRAVTPGDAPESFITLNHGSHHVTF